VTCKAREFIPGPFSPQSDRTRVLYALTMKPKIVIPLALGDEPKESPRYFTRIAYAESIERAGGIPIFLSRPKGSDLQQIYPLMDGLLLMGGVDPHPNLYGEEVLPTCGAIDRERDALELGLLSGAIEAGVPVLGLCRGLQIMNIHFGGSLYQDLPTQFPSNVKHESHATLERKKPMHAVEILPGTLLGTLVGGSRIEVNSIHHQGIKVLGTHLRASAKSPDGLIEAIEHETLPFCVGTQWHPEEFHGGHADALFGAFMDEARKRAPSRIS
jgi:putative glutamine amidotransferase